MDAVLPDVAEKLIDGGALIDYTSPQVFVTLLNTSWSNVSRTEAHLSFVVAGSYAYPRTPLLPDREKEKDVDKSFSTCCFNTRQILT